MTAKNDKTAAVATATADPAAKYAGMDLSQMLGMLLASQAETANLQRQLLEREIQKDDAIAKKDALALARIERDRKQLLEQMQIRQKNLEAQIARCSHKDQRGGSTLYVISNHPDRRIRGVCMHCPIYIQPDHYEIAGDGKQTLVDEH